MSYSYQEERIRKILEELGLNPKQVEAGLKYYRNFCVKLEIPESKCVRMIYEMIENMKKRICDTKN